MRKIPKNPRFQKIPPFFGPLEGVKPPPPTPMYGLISMVVVTEIQ